MIIKICNEFEVDFHYFVKEKKENKVKINEIQKLSNCDVLENNYSENIIEQLKMLVNDIEQKEAKIKELEKK